MTVGILTFNFAINYGAVIQAWALSRQLKSKGHTVKIINYNPARRGLPWWIRVLMARSWWRFVQTVKFHLFRTKYLSESHVVRDVKDLEHVGFDAIVVGSDQVWNVEYFTEPDGHYNRMYFLAKLSKRIRRIAYAVSIGHGQWNTYSLKEELLADVRAFDHVSVREKFAQEKLAHLGLASICVPDPTLLIQQAEYDALSRIKPKRQPYIFSYLLTEVDRGREVCEECQKCLCFPVRMAMLQTKTGNENLPPSPRQWLELLRNASFMITDSFHGVALSIVFNVPFIALLKPNKQGMNARIVDLLSFVGLSERVVESHVPLWLLTQDIDWKQVNDRVRDMRETGAAFLEEALYGVN